MQLKMNDGIRIYLKRFIDVNNAKRDILERYAKDFGICGLLHISYEPNGRPLLFKDGKQCKEISVSHTDDMLAIAFSDSKVGIDLERADRAINNRLCRSIEDWTRYEAYGKWLGTGVSRDLLAKQLPCDMLRTHSVRNFYLSVCDNTGADDIITIIDNNEI